MRHVLLAGLAALAVSASASGQAQSLRLDEFEIAPARRSEPAPAPQSSPRSEDRTQAEPPASQPRPQAQPTQPRPARQSAPRDTGPWPADILVLMRRAVPNTPAPALCIQPGHTQLASRASAAHGIPAHALDPHTPATGCTILAGSNERLVETLRRSRMHIAHFAITRDTRVPRAQATR